MPHDVKLDHFVGRKIVDSRKTDEGYELELEGNVIIRSFDKRRAAPKNVIGLVFLTVALSENKTRLIVGVPESQGEWQEIVLTPTKYEVRSPEGTFTQRSAANDLIEEREKELGTDEAVKELQNSVPLEAAESDSKDTDE